MTDQLVPEQHRWSWDPRRTDTFQLAAREAPGPLARTTFSRWGVRGGEHRVYFTLSEAVGEESDGATFPPAGIIHAD